MYLRRLLIFKGYFLISQRFAQLAFHVIAALSYIFLNSPFSKISADSRCTGYLVHPFLKRKRSEEKNQTGVIFGKHYQFAQLFSRSSLLAGWSQHVWKNVKNSK
jgi:hypothetical protein